MVCILGFLDEIVLVHFLFVCMLTILKVTTSSTPALTTKNPKPEDVQAQEVAAQLKARDDLGMKMLHDELWHLICAKYIMYHCLWV